MIRDHGPAVLIPGGPLDFPDARRAPPGGLLAIGGDLSVPRLLRAYGDGVFPWYDEGMPPLWWSPNPRAVLDDTHLHVSRSMTRVLKSQRFHLSWNRAFQAVMQGCASDRSDGTWILPEMLRAYVALHSLGHAHSVEVWEGDALVGGLYGVQCGALFAAESMFHRSANASKVALIAAVRSLFAAGVEVFDVQFLTSHLATMGAYEMSRNEYLDRVHRARGRTLDLSSMALSAEPKPSVTGL